MPQNNRVVIARYTNSGFGDHLSCVLGAWALAKATDRSLIVDWRGSRFNPTPGKNCFFDFFRPIECLAGVPISASEDWGGYELDTPIHPPKWSKENLSAIAHVPHSADEFTETNRMVMQRLDRPEPTIVINQHTNGLSNDTGIQACLRELNFNDQLETRAQSFLDKISSGQPVIGVHLRHGNGENIGYRAGYWLSPLRFLQQRMRDSRVDVHARNPQGQPTGKFLDNTAESLTSTHTSAATEHALYGKVRKAVANLRLQPGLEDAIVLLFTDATRVERGLSREMDNIHTYSKMMLPDAEGPLHQISSLDVGEDAPKVSEETIDDLLIESALLRRCSAIVCMPSQFTLFARLGLPTERIAILDMPFVNRVIEKLASKL